MTPEQLAALTPADLIKKHREIKGYLEDEDARLKPYKGALAVLEGALASKMLEQGVKSFPTEFGTAYQSPVLAIKVADRETFFKFVVDNFHTIGKDLLTANASKDAVKTYMETSPHNQPPPGITVETIINTNVRKPT